MEKLNLSCEGPAYIIVPLSEDPIRRLLFNDIVEFSRDGKTVDNIEDLEIVDSLMERVISMLLADPLLGDTLLPNPENPENREEYKLFHRKLWDRLQEMEQL